jgi:hypothetical protein
METKGVGQEGMEKCLESSQGPNWAVEPLVVVVCMYVYIYSFLFIVHITSAIATVCWWHECTSVQLPPIWIPTLVFPHCTCSISITKAVCKYAVFKCKVQYNCLQKIIPVIFGSTLVCLPSCDMKAPPHKHT